MGLYALTKHSVFKMLLCIIFILIRLSRSKCLTCDEVVDMTTKKQLTFQELSTMSPEDINDCLQYIAKDPLNTEDANFIWKTLIDFYKGIANIPGKKLAQLQWASVAIAPEDFENITIDTINVVRNFGYPYNFAYTQLDVIADRVRQDFAGKSPEDYTCYDLEALNQILCVFNRSEIERIHPAAYREAALFIGKIKNCLAEALIGFGNLATHKNAFGPIEKWTGLIWTTVGNVAEYLDIPKEIKKKLEAEKEEIDEKEIALSEFKKRIYNAAMSKW